MNAVGMAVRGRESGMRIWGNSSFENEAAMRWVEGLEDAPDLDMVEATLDDILEADDAGEIPDPTVSSHAIAAAETVAALAASPASALPEEVRQWCFDNPAADLTEVQPKAVQALGVILTGSGLRELFDSSGQVDHWEVEVEGLRDRLRG